MADGQWLTLLWYFRHRELAKTIIY
jgi:hypothetical protein